MRLHVQNFLTGAALVEGPDGVVVPGLDPLVGLSQLTALFGIKVKQHPVYPELYHLSYDQLESPKDNPIVQECRGLILNSQDNWNVVAFPFRRFANYGESWAASVDWETMRVQDKVDGSLMILWFYEGTWNVSTKGSPDAGGQVGDFNFTFADLFWKTVGNTTFLMLNPDYTYMIELTSIYNRVVCSYGAAPALTLIGVRNIVAEGLPEMPVSEFAHLGIPVVKEYPLTTISEIEKAAIALDPMKNEGFVVVDKFFNRVKMKSPSYVMIHHMKDGFGQRRIIRLIQLGETSEVLSYFPEYQKLFDEVGEKINNLIADIEAEYDRIRHLTDRKEFALEAQKSKNSGVLFALFLGKVKDVRDYILYSKKVIKKATATEEATEDFAFSPEKIEAMAGLKARPDVLFDE